MSQRAIDLDWYVAAEDSARELEAGWDTCPICGSVAFVEDSLIDAGEYVVGCMDIDCGRRYVVVTP